MVFKLQLLFVTILMCQAAADRGADVTFATINKLGSMLATAAEKQGMDVEISDATSQMQRRMHTSSLGSGGLSCGCTPDSADWSSPTREAGEPPRMVYLDLGARNGDTFPPPKLATDFTHLSWTCGKDYADIFEANKEWTDVLQKKASACPHSTAFTETAISHCDGHATFHMTPGDGLGDTMNDQSPHRKKWEAQGSEINVRVPTANLMRILHERTIPEDHVVVKMDIEGAELDILPCLAKSKSAKLMDYLLVERHDKKLNIGPERTAAFEETLAKLRGMGIKVNDSWP